MGIQGLLQNLKSITEQAHIRDFHGKRVGVDVSCWLHRGAISCARKLAKKETTDQYLVYVMKQVRMLKENGVVPVIVFDGAEVCCC